MFRLVEYYVRARLHSIVKSVTSAYMSSVYKLKLESGDAMSVVRFTG